MTNPFNTDKKILFDAFELVHGYGKSLGIYRYAINLFRKMVKSIPEAYELILVCNSLNQHDFLVSSQVKNCQVKCIKIDKMSSLKKLFWEWFGASKIMKQTGADIYYSPKGFAPGFFKKPSSYKIVLTIHDLIPLWYARQGMKGGLIKRYVVWALQRSTKWADTIMADSHATRLDIESYCERKDNVQVVYCGLDQKPDVKDQRPLEKEYIFSVGSSHPHKNIDTLCKAYTLYKEKCSDPIPLVICTNAPVPDGVKGISNLTDADLSTWYRHAKCFVFPSIVEGFGFPPLEAMRNGIPVIAADTPIQNEILGDACIYFDPLSAESLSEKLLSLLNDSEMHKRFSDAGNQRWKRYNWKDCSNRAWDVFKNCY